MPKLNRPVALFELGLGVNLERRFKRQIMNTELILLLMVLVLLFLED
jgi:hypothetical protein